ncbi:MAG: hypothetical protein PHY99_00880 [Bacteroidales bacterium]|nr:hypothetical protein [Bacteroidales bacterium]
MKKLFPLLYGIFLFTFLIGEKGVCQEYSRIRADFAVKIKTISGGQSLTMGQVYYDRNIKQVIYDISFPEKEIWITSDTLVYQIRQGKLISKTATLSMAEFTVFHLALNSQLQDFGLKNSAYAATDVQREQDLVITTWVPPAKNKEKPGNILVSVKNKQLFGVIIQDPEGTILRKQFFENYQVISGLSFPGKIVEINITNGLENYQVTTYKNIVIDELENDSKYFYNTSGLHL